MLTFRLSFTLPRVETFFRKEKMALRELLRKFFIVGNLNGKLVAAEYLSKLLDNEKNYKVFERFSRECSNTLQCVLCTAWDIVMTMKR